MVAPLVGLDFREKRRITAGHRKDPPVVVVAGGRGMGKTAALREICGAYGNRTPRALLDLADVRYAEDDGERDPRDAPLLRVLQDLKWNLEMEVRSRRVRFPRLSLALLAITTWQPDDDLTLDQARQRLAMARDSVARIAHADRDGWASDWIADVAAELAVHAFAFPADVFVKATVHAFVKKTLSAHNQRAPLTWHKEYDTGEPGDAYDALVMLGLNFHMGGDFRSLAEENLVAAFLADVSAEYRGLAGMTVAGFPIALLDNAHLHPVGVRFLRLVLGSRARAKADPLVIVATGPGSLAGQVTAPVPGENRSVPGDTLLLRADLTPLDKRVVLRMLGGADPQRLPPELAQLIQRLTGGLPLGVEVITRAVVHAVPAAVRHAGPPLNPATILDLPVPTPEGDGNLAQSVAAQLVEQLLPDQSWRSRLITLAPARDSEAAQALVTSLLGADGDVATVAEAAALLRANGWESGPDHFIGDRFLRTLLLNRLTCRPAYPTSAEVHETLRDLYADGGAGPLAPAEPARLYHCLALGDAAHVVRRLHDVFKGADAEVWLDDLDRAAHAPLGSRPDHRADVARGAGQVIPDEVHRSISRLLHAAWFLNDPLIVPDPVIARKITQELRLLAGVHPTGNEVLTETATAWPTRLTGWQQAGPRPAREK